MTSAVCSVSDTRHAVKGGNLCASKPLHEANRVPPDSVTHQSWSGLLTTTATLNLAFVRPTPHCHAMDINIESDDFESGEIAREYAVQEALSAALDRAEQQTDERQLHRDVVSHTVECCMQSCVSVVEMTFVTREPQPLDPDPLSESSWQPDTEAPPCAPDTWMRGVIQIRKPQQRQTSSVSTGRHHLYQLSILAAKAVVTGSRYTIMQYIPWCCLCR